jgi:hypothetical protein
MTRRTSHSLFFIITFCVCFSADTARPQQSGPQSTLEDIAKQALSSQSSPISESEITAAQQFGNSISIAQWLGPMAPVALSPFFGITCLSGMSIFGGEWIAKGNPLLGDNSPLHNPAVFWTFLSLTILTSIPRFTKVSKPFAQAVDQLEAWSGIVTMITLRILMASAGETAEAPEVVQAGLLSLSMDTLMMLAAAINIFVINAVKFFFEVLIWLTPIPFLDAAFEVLNKSLCIALMAVYAWSPTFATALNLAMFVAAMIIFGWVHRRQVFFRTMLMELVWATFAKSSPSGAITVFPVSPVGKIKSRARCSLSHESNGWILTHRPILRSMVTQEFRDVERPTLLVGIFTNTITFSQPSVQLTFGRLYNSDLSGLAVHLNANLPNGGIPSVQPRTEFA